MSELENIDVEVDSELRVDRDEIESAIRGIARDEAENVAGGGGAAVDSDTLREHVAAVIRAEWGEQLDDAIGRIMLPSRKLGPAPGGAYHPVPGWGIRLRFAREAHLGSCVVDAETSGSFVAVLSEYDGSTAQAVESREISVDEGVNFVDLDMKVPSAGEYLLSREGDFPLRRREWGGWESQSRGGVELVGGSKADDGSQYSPYSDNEFWYYFFNLQVASSEDAH